MEEQLRSCADQPQALEKLTDNEVDIMMAVWNSPNDAVSTGEILRQIKLEKHMTLQSLQVVLRRLCEKGALKCEKSGRSNYYSALNGKKEYLDFALHNFVNHHYAGSIKRFLVALLQESHFGENDLEQLHTLLEQQRL